MLAVIVEGLDCSGKETLCKGLEETLKVLLSNSRTIGNKGVNTAGLDVHVEKVAFPRYDTPHGVRIKSALMLPEEQRNLPKLISLFRDDRLDYLRSAMKTNIKQKEVDGVIYISGDIYINIFDRFAGSNVICNLHKVMEGYNDVSDALNADTTYAGLTTLCNMGMLNVFIGANTTKAIAKHKEYLASREDKDANENWETQRTFNNNINLGLAIGALANRDKLYLEVGFDMKDAITKIANGVVSMVKANSPLIANRNK